LQTRNAAVAEAVSAAARGLIQLLVHGHHGLHSLDGQHSFRLLPPCVRKRRRLVLVRPLTERHAGGRQSGGLLRREQRGRRDDRLRWGWPPGRRARRETPRESGTGGVLRGRSLHSYGRGGSLAKPWCPLTQPRKTQRPHHLRPSSRQREQPKIPKTQNSPNNPTLAPSIATPKLNSHSLPQPQKLNSHSSPKKSRDAQPCSRKHGCGVRCRMTTLRACCNSSPLKVPECALYWTRGR
jgi:hypothetical protein